MVYWVIGAILGAIQFQQSATLNGLSFNLALSGLLACLSIAAWGLYQEARQSAIDQPHRRLGWRVVLLLLGFGAGFYYAQLFALRHADQLWQGLDTGVRSDLSEQRDWLIEGEVIGLPSLTQDASGQWVQTVVIQPRQWARYRPPTIVSAKAQKRATKKNKRTAQTASSTHVTTANQPTATPENLLAGQDATDHARRAVGPPGDKTLVQTKEQKSEINWPAVAHATSDTVISSPQSESGEVNSTQPELVKAVAEPATLAETMIAIETESLIELESEASPEITSETNSATAFASETAVAAAASTAGVKKTTPKKRTVRLPKGAALYDDPVVSLYKKQAAKARRRELAAQRRAAKKLQTPDTLTGTQRRSLSAHKKPTSRQHSRSTRPRTELDTVQRLSSTVAAVSDPEWSIVGRRRLFPLLPAAQTQFPERIRVAYYSQQQATIFVPGDIWRLNVRLAPAHGSLNLHSFDYEQYLWRSGVAATGHLRAQPFIVQRDNAASLSKWRYTLAIAIDRALQGQTYHGVVQALTIGTQNVIPRLQWQQFNQLGIGHLISISGMHVTLVAWWGALLLGFAWSRLHWPWRGIRRYAPMIVPTGQMRLIIALVIATVYSLIAGFGVPAQRTLFMLATVVVARYWGRHIHWSTILAWAAVVVIVFDPMAVIAPGFWLSFIAVAILLLTPAPINTDWRARLRYFFYTQWRITAGLALPSLFLFSQVSLLGPIANTIAIPVFSALITPLALLGALLSPFNEYGAAFFWRSANGVLDALMALLIPLTQNAWGQWLAPQLPLSGLMVGLSGVAFVVYSFQQRRWRWLSLCAGLLILAGVLTWRPSASPAGEFAVTVFDVGQGTAVAIRTANHIVLYDTGPRYGPESDAAERVLIPYLQKSGIGSLDAVVISHDDSDHTGGWSRLQAALPIKQVYTSLPAQHPLWSGTKAPRIAIRPCQSGQDWQWDGVRFSWLTPAPAATYKNDNETSCVLRVDNGQRSLLLMGDNEHLSETGLLQQRATELKSEVLLVPHHGSKTSSSEPFLDAVQPRFGVIQNGFLNRYRHPHPQVLARYATRRIPLYRTDLLGSISLDSRCQDWCIETFRQQHGRYWHTPQAAMKMRDD